MGIAEASLILEEINHSGGNAAACHAQMYIMGTLLRHGHEEQKRRYLPKLASGELRLQAFGVTEPSAGSETTRIQTNAVRTIRTMLNHHTTELFITDLEIPVENLIGEEGMGFRYIINGWNAERILISAESIGDGRWFIERAAKYARERVIFGRPIGANQGVQFPLAWAHAHLEAANLVRLHAGWLFDRSEPCGAQANMAKLLAADAAWQAANARLDILGGYGFAAEYDVERKFRETRLYKVAPVSDKFGARLSQPACVRAPAIVLRLPTDSGGSRHRDNVYTWRVFDVS